MDEQQRDAWVGWSRRVARVNRRKGREMRQWEGGRLPGWEDSVVQGQEWPASTIVQVALKRSNGNGRTGDKHASNVPVAAPMPIPFHSLGSFPTLSCP